MLFLYNLFLLIASPIWVPWMLWRTGKRQEKPNWRERFGHYPFGPKPDGKRVWLHAVSVGEVVAALPVLKELRTRATDLEIVLSVTTSSGHQTARERAEGLFDHLVYFPIDLPKFQVRAMQRVKPAVVAVMETELWFNFLWTAKAFRARTLLVNGRISDRSFPRSMRFRAYYRTLLRYVDRCLMQSERDAERIRALGAESAEIVGNVKFDQALEGLETDAAGWRAKLGLPEGVPVVVVGSTRGEEEEQLVTRALSPIKEKVSVVWAPRHLERADAVETTMTANLGSAARRSRGEIGQYVVLDTYGELDRVYSVADIVIVGGGFENLGGQNLIQPLAHGKPVLHGPHMQNFRDVADAARAAGATRICTNAEELERAISELLADPGLCAKMGTAARELIHSGSGAAIRYVEAILSEADRGPAK